MSQATCEACGEANPLKSEFCAACGGYLGWQDGGPAAESTGGSPAGAQSATSSAPPVDEPHPALAVTRTLPAVVPQQAVPVPATAGSSAARMTAADVDQGSSTCPSPTCGVSNARDRRFCAKCGAALGGGGAAAALPASQPAPVSGWRRALPSRTQETLAARRAYRRSLPTRYRVTRIVAGVAALALAGGLLAIAGHSPMSWATDRWHAVRGTLVAVDDITATVASKTAVNPNYPPNEAVDGAPDTAWATTWDKGGTANPACGARIPKGGRTPLTLALPERTTIRGVEIAPGLPATDPQRVLQWRPVLLRLTFDDGSCQQVALPDRAGLNEYRLRAVATSTVQVDVARAAKPRSGNGNLVALGEIQLLRRPG